LLTNVSFLKFDTSEKAEQMQWSKHEVHIHERRLTIDEMKSFFKELSRIESVVVQSLVEMLFLSVRFNIAY